MAAGYPVWRFGLRQADDRSSEKLQVLPFEMGGEDLGSMPRAGRLSLGAGRPVLRRGSPRGRGGGYLLHILSPPQLVAILGKYADPRVTGDR